jgi:hypothetical protein
MRMIWYMTAPRIAAKEKLRSRAAPSPPRM